MKVVILTTRRLLSTRGHHAIRPWLVPLLRGFIEQLRGMLRAQQLPAADVIDAAHAAFDARSLDDEIGELVAFLAGPHSASITGAALPVDGGWTAQ